MLLFAMITRYPRAAQTRTAPFNFLDQGFYESHLVSAPASPLVSGYSRQLFTRFLQPVRRTTGNSGW
ncbi:hypothetical protein WJX77_003647 [Trebouxia sp. C0004]